MIDFVILIALYSAASIATITLANVKSMCEGASIRDVEGRMERTSYMTLLCPTRTEGQRKT